MKRMLMIVGIAGLLVFSGCDDVPTELAEFLPPETVLNETLLGSGEAAGSQDAAGLPVPGDTVEVTPEVLPETTEEAPPAAENAPEEQSAPAAPVDMAAINRLPNDNNGWGFVKKPGVYPEFTAAHIRLMDQYGCVYEGSHEEKVMYLTFDEGYENGYTAPILDTLKEKGAPATFFITGPYLEKNGDLIRRMIDEGHTVGNHTVNHPNMPSLGTAEAMQEEMLALDRSFYERYGTHMSFFRPPEGAYSERSLAATAAAGYRTVLWSFAYRDWETDNQKGAQYAVDSVVPYFHNGCVLLLHAVSSDNAGALSAIIDAAREQGYTLLPLSEYR